MEKNGLGKKNFTGMSKVSTKSIEKKRNVASRSYFHPHIRENAL